MANDNDDMLAQLQEAMREQEEEYNNTLSAMLEDFKAKGYNIDVAKQFICLRFHQHHPWGLLNVIHNGKEITVIAAPIKEPDEKGGIDVQIAFIPVQEGMKFSTKWGHESNDKFEIYAGPHKGGLN